MTVLIEAFSVIVRLDALEKLGPELSERFYKSIPNSTYYADKWLGRVGFMVSDEAIAYSTFLQSTFGLVSANQSGEVAGSDYMVIPQGELAPFQVSWLKKFAIDCSGVKVEVAAFVDEDGQVCLEENPNDFIAYEGWSIDKAIRITGNSRYIKTLRNKDGGVIDIYISASGEKLNTGRQAKWFDLPILCLVRMPLRMCILTSIIGAILLKNPQGPLVGALFGVLLGLVVCTQFAKELPMTPHWLYKLLGGR